MINSYSGKQNPCTFCEEDDNESNNNDFLELALCGNETALFVREVSVEDLAKEKEDKLSIENVSETTEQPAPHKGSTRISTASTKVRKKSSQETRASHGLNALNTKKWSGNTYFEEEIRRLQEQQYNKELRKALKMRKLWHCFEKEVVRDIRRELVKNSGPEWWQEPSRKQIVLATTLKEVIKADYEEEVTGRTRQWLLDLGVTARLTPRQIRKCMTLSLMEPVDFLLEAHAFIVKSQLKVKKNHLQRPFSVDERLLLSAVCVLQLPTLITMLHYMLPPPKPYSVDKRIQELLFGNLDDETIRYATPYMELLPFRNRIDYEDWAFGKIYSALLPVLLQDQGDCPSKDKPISLEKNPTELKQTLRVGSQHMIQTNRLSNYSTTPSITLLLSYCLGKRQHVSDSMKVNIDVESTRRRTYGRRLTFMGKGHHQSKLTDIISRSENSINPGAISVKSAESESPGVTRVESLPTLHENNGDNSGANQPNQPVQEEFPQYPVYSTGPGRYTYSTPNPPSQPYYNEGYEQPTYGDYGRSITSKSENVHSALRHSKDNSVSKVKRADPDSNSNLKTTLISGQTVEESQSDTGEGESVKSSRGGEGSRESMHKQLMDVWKEIESYPENEQLQRAIKVLEGMGDPLAQLPRVHELPSIQRWIELRRGENRILSKKKKEELIKLSRGTWKSVHFAYSAKCPAVGISKEEERKLTWDKKKWLESEVRKETQKYFSRIKQEKVDNARSFFPTMLNHYDYGSKLNRNFRDLYYTYLPAREADTFVYRPWQPQETRNSK